MKNLGFVFASLMLLVLAGCNSKKEKPNLQANDVEEVADSTVYGVCGEGTSMHSLELITDTGDTLTYTILDAEADMDGMVTGGGLVSHVEG